MKTWFEKRRGTIQKALLGVVVLILVAGGSLFIAAKDVSAATVIVDGVTKDACRDMSPTAAWSWDGPDGGVGKCRYDDGTPIRPVDENADPATNENTGLKNNVGNDDYAPASCEGLRLMRCGLGGVVEWLIYLVWQIFGIMLSFAGLTLDLSIDIGVVGFKQLVKGVPSITLAWSVFRDVITASLIFVLLYAGISMILGLGSPARVLRGVIITGLLINFSFFFTSIIIDTSNVLSVEIYEAIQEHGNKSRTISTGTASLSGVSSALMQGLKPQSFTGTDPGVLPGTYSHQFAKIMQMLMGSIFLLVATFTLFFIAFVFLIRMVMFILLLITSPIAVVRGLFPQFNRWSDMWWKELVSNAFQAPVLMLFMLITVVVVNDAGFRGSIDNVALIKTSSETSIAAQFILSVLGGSFANFITFFIAIGLLVAGIIIAKNVGGGLSSKATSAASSFAGRLAFGGVALGGAYTLGKTGKAMAESNYLNRLKSGEEGFIKQRVGSSLVDVGTRMGKAGWDVRGALPDKLAGAAAPGYIDRQKALEKERKEGAKQIDENNKREAAEDAKRRRAEEIARFDQIDAEIATKRDVVIEARKVLAASTTEAARAEAANRTQTFLMQLGEAEEFKAKGRPKNEEDARQNLSQVSSRVRPEDIGTVTAVLNSDDIKKMEEGPKKQAKILGRLSEQQKEYYHAMQELIDIEKQRGLYEKDYRAKFAAMNANTNSEETREVVDKVRKDLNKSQKDRAFDAMVEALEKEEAIKKPKGGGTEDKEGAPAQTENKTT